MESVAAARSRASLLRLRPERAVLAGDYQALAESTPGVAIARAHVAVGYHPDFPCHAFPGAVTVFIVPEVPRPAQPDDPIEFTWVAAPAPDAGSTAAVAARLEAARLLCTEVFVRAVTFRALRLHVAVAADAAAADDVRASLERGLRSALDPLGGLQGSTAAWPFGGPVRPSSLRREAQAVLGDRGEVLDLAIGVDGAEPSERCDDVPIGAHELVYLDGLDVELRQSPRATGGLR
jgi:hypothetical protein